MMDGHVSMLNDFSVSTLWTERLYLIVLDLSTKTFYFVPIIDLHIT